MNHSIKQRLLLYLISFTLVVWGVISINSYYDTRHQIEELFDAQLAQSAKVLLELSAHELHEQLAYLSMTEETNNTLEHPIPVQVHKYEQILDYQIWISDKKNLVVRTNNAPDVMMTDKEDVFTDYFNKGTHLRVYALSNKENTIHVQVAGHYGKRDEISNAISARFLYSMGLSLPLLAILILVGIGKSFAPLEKITKEMKTRNFDNLTAINTHDTPTEVRPLITALNLLFTKLEVAFGNISRFTADAAHELRTPLAALKVNAQVALREKDELSRNLSLDKVIIGVDNATNIVEQLLMLSRLDPESMVIKDENPDLSSITEESIAELTPKALERNIEISLKAQNKITVKGKAGMLQIMVKNLVANAIRYTPENGVIEVSIKQNDNDVLLRVADSGPGIPEHDVENVFKRFYRGDNSNNIQGTGLGLSIVSRIIEIHHAKITLGKSRFNGLQVDVILTSTTKQNTTNNTINATNNAAA